MFSPIGYSKNCVLCNEESDIMVGNICKDCYINKEKGEK